MAQAALHSSTSQNSLYATAIGVIAVLLWSCLALLTTLTEGIPAFQLLALSFAVAFMASVGVIGCRGVEGFKQWRQPWAVWVTGFGGIFAYHALYFYALKVAPAAQASLIAYLWPLLIVLLSALAARQGLQWRQVLGALLGLAGTAFILQQRNEAQLLQTPWLGYAAAFGCALVWSSYSVINRRFRGVSSNVIGAICGLVTVAGGVCHGLFETWVPPTAPQWAAIVGLGLGPVGLAFFAWDHATKHGSLGMLGALSYLAPLVSTLLLIAVGASPANPMLLIAAGLIIAGAALATLRTR
ncbi:DMT family transporter [Pseudomonas sp. R5(2019)]|uniref:aromatic amino acid exporter YddG n=1 Tax=Pseudomonas sp. R5(2019) TaxID=2697566 RepID=UPI001412FBFE|nr:EamA family transporter [Pseudomonas sp. R5(2019)]NBA98596.1 EamA family transporter [Pseudomonas sp. R5(2019)]